MKSAHSSTNRRQAICASSVTKLPLFGQEVDQHGAFGFSNRPHPDPLQIPEFALHNGTAHLLTVGPTGAGKTSMMIANLLQYAGSVISVDVKGDAARATARFRREVFGQPTHVIDPFGVTGLQSISLDPLCLADLPRVEVEAEAQSIAATIATDHRSERDPYWAAQASSLIASIVAYLLDLPEREEHSMNRVIDMLFSDDTAYEIAVLLDTKIKKGSFAYGGLSAWLQLPDSHANTRFCVLSTAHSMLHPFRSSSIRASMAGPSINLTDLLEGRPITIFLVLPIERIASHGIVLRLWLDVLLQALLRRERPSEIPTLVMVDEAAQIGPCPALKLVSTYLRASGVRLWSFWQDLAQLRSIYPSDWQTLVTNTSALTCLPGNGVAAREFASLVGVSESMVSGMAPGEHLICETGSAPRLVNMLRYWCDRRFAHRFDPLPRYSTSPRMGSQPADRRRRDRVKSH